MKDSSLQAPIKVWYSSLPVLPKVLWPIISLQLRYKAFSLPQPLDALIDSGASISVLHPFVAELLGFNLAGMKKASGISASGKYESWILPEPLEIKIYDYTFYARFTVINNPRFMWACILGEDSIFEVARLDFQKFRGYFELRFRSDIN